MDLDNPGDVELQHSNQSIDNTLVLLQHSNQSIDNTTRHKRDPMAVSRGFTILRSSSR
jgi:hypothetical protein